MIDVDPLAHLVEHSPFKAGVPRSSRGWVIFMGRMAELVDAHALGACGATHGGSSPLPPIQLICQGFKIRRGDLVLAGG